CFWLSQAHLARLPTLGTCGQRRFAALLGMPSVQMHPMLYIGARRTCSRRSMSSFPLILL
ncbi:unnamed protein product, partial [Symbiodinium necroappetens]